MQRLHRRLAVVIILAAGLFHGCGGGGGTTAPPPPAPPPPPPAPVVIAQIAPAAMVEGQAATLTGTGFSATPLNNTVRIGGIAATVTQATATSLQVSVPSGACVPRGQPVEVQVTVGTVSSNVVAHPLHPASVVQLAVGQLAVIQSPADRCVQFDAAAGAERYVIGVQSTSEVPATLTGLRVEGRVGAGAGVAPLAPVPVAEARAVPTLSAADLRARERWQQHLAATAVLYEQQRVMLQPLLDRAPRPHLAPGPFPAPSVPGGVVEGQTLPVRVATSGSCADFVTINGKIRKITAEAIFIEDEGNPVFLDDAVYTTFGADFVAIYAQSVDHLGPVSDRDGNGRIVIVVTKQVNRITLPGDLPIGGFVNPGDAFTTAQCPLSNEGEFFYLRSPDPAGIHGGVTTVAEVEELYNWLLLHEFAHIIQVARRLAVGGQFMVSWIAEMHATAAQEVVGFLLTGMQHGQNYGPEKVYASFGAAPPRHLFRYMDNLVAYFGHNFPPPLPIPEPPANGGPRIPGTPEECTWIGVTLDAPGPCSDAITLRYGVPWSLVKFIIDRHLGGPASHKQILRAFSDYAGPVGGFAELEAILGRPIATMMAEWAPMLYIDDRYPGAPLFQLANWNLRAIAAAWGADADLVARSRGFTGFVDQVSVRAASSAYYDVSGANRPATAIRVRDLMGGALPPLIQIWVVRVQ